MAVTMKARVLLGLLLSGLLCGCASNTPYSQTSAPTPQTVLPQAPLTPQVGPNRP